MTKYLSEAPLPILTEILACPLLSVVALVELNDTVPDTGSNSKSEGGVNRDRETLNVKA